MDKSTQTAYDKYLQPIIDKYELAGDKNAQLALIESFKAALQFARDVMAGNEDD